MILLAEINLAVGDPLPGFMPMGVCKWMEEATKETPVAVLKIFGSEFSDPGPDHNKYVLYDSQGNEIASKTVNGY